jgi:type VI secretion system protein
MTTPGRRGLLARLAASEGSLAPLGHPVASITEHLRALLNTRKGESVSAPGFGILDFNDVLHLYPAAISRMQQSIRAAIQEFEPRLRSVAVVHVPEEQEPTALRFDIIAQLHLPGRGDTVRFHTRLHPGGQADIW